MKLVKKLSVFSVQGSFSVNNQFKMLHSLFNQTYKKNCPVSAKVVSVKLFKLPWLTDNLLPNLKEKHRLHMAFINKTVSKNTYTSHCDSLNKVIFHAMRSYYEERFLCCSNHPKKTWKQSNKVLKLKKPKNKWMLCHNNHNNHNPADIVECFSKYFCDSQRSLHYRIQPVNNSPLQYVNRIENPFVLYPITESDVEGAFIKIKTNGRRSNFLLLLLSKIFERIMH